MPPTRFGLFTQQYVAEEPVFAYPLLYPDPVQSRTPLRLANRGTYNLLVLQGLPSVAALHSLVQNIFEGGWPKEAEDGELDYFHEIAPGRYFIDERGLPLIKLRIVLTRDGDLMVALNGAGSYKVPFHHQMAISRAMIVNNVVDYDQHMRRSCNPVLFAGEFLMGSDGKVHGVTNRSGHYKPPVSSLEVILDWLSLRPGCLAELLLVQALDGQSSAHESYSKLQIQLRSTQLTVARNLLLSKNDSAVLHVRTAQAQMPQRLVSRLPFPSLGS